ncbi:MAG: FimB/Mfa2 family fimbrial subunit [Odoribacteraceae bacterium]|nr:FimB/Mfa2 family fimbrial subunit [Odoribacteraceae bacterium]
MKKKRLLFVFLAGVAVAYLCVSCTYDYFVDETNYRIFVPEVASGAVKGCYVAVYNEAGALVRSRSTGVSDDPRAKTGVFAFRLQPGKYTAYCYANVDDLQIVEAASADQAFISMKPVNARDSHAYALPPEVVFQKLTPEIGNRFEQRVDTTSLERYVGRITVRFKNIPVSLPDVMRVQLEADGVATRQYFSRDTLTSRFTEQDYIFDESLATPGKPGGEWEVDHYYFPSIPDQLTRLTIRFLNASGGVLNEIPVEVMDTKTVRPLPLLHGRRIILEIDSYMIIGIGLTGWDEDIDHSGREI